jgi:uncharacterized membrane protein YhaH (DUF805 family)
MHLGWFLFATEGRINREPFWIFNIFLSLAYLLFLYSTKQYSQDYQQQLALLFIGVFIWPSIAVQAKRWHDTGRSAWWILLSFIPFLGPLFSLYMNGFVKGTEGENRFGPDPLQPQQAEQ